MEITFIIPIEFNFEGEHYSEQQHTDSDVIASNKIQVQEARSKTSDKI